MSEEIQEPTIAEDSSENRPDWLPSNFKSPEDLAQSYREAQANLTRTRQELSEVKDQVGQILATQQETQRATEYGTIEAQLLDAVESGDPQAQLAAMAWIAQQAAQQYAPQQTDQSPNTEVLAFAAEQQMAQKYQDWNEIKLDIASLVSEDPDLLPVDPNTPLATVVQRLDRVYKIAKANKVLSQTEQVVQAEEAQNRLIKQQAQTITGASQTPATTDPESEYWASVKNTAPGNYVPVGRI